MVSHGQPLLTWTIPASIFTSYRHQSALFGVLITGWPAVSVLKMNACHVVCVCVCVCVCVRVLVLVAEDSSGKVSCLALLMFYLKRVAMPEVGQLTAVICWAIMLCRFRVTSPTMNGRGEWVPRQHASLSKTPMHTPSISLQTCARPCSVRYYCDRQPNGTGVEELEHSSVCGSACLFMAHV